MWTIGSVVITKAEGRMDAGGVIEFTRALERQMPKGLTEIWDDWSRVHSYEPEARKTMRDWTDRHRAIASHIRVLVGSKIVAMGLTVANLALGNAMKVYSDARTFEADLLVSL